MPTSTLDQRGLLIGGTRRWMVGGTVDYNRTPAALWGDRLDEAVAAGLNTITVPVAWSAHEPRPGAFSFSGDQDLGAFLSLIAERGLMAVLRPGPFIGDGWDRGGLPSWVDAGTDDAGAPRRLRSDAPAFLKAASAWIRAVAEIVRPHLVTEGGPVVLVQNEHRWFCGDTGSAYLSELSRYLTENGLRVPHLSTNNLYASAEGETEAWNGYEHLLSTVRQLRSVRPGQACVVADLELGRPAVWGDAQAASADPDEAQHAVVQALAAGASFNLGPFAGGSRFGFTGGRLPFVRDGYLTQSADAGAPLSETGARTALLGAIAPALQFASSFERTLGGVKWDSARAGLDPAGPGPAVVHAAGDLGSVVFVFRDPAAGKKDRGAADVLLPSGVPMRVDLKDRAAVWCLLDAPLGDRHTLDYCNASAVWFEGRSLAVTAPAGSAVSLSINGSALDLTAPAGKTPVTVEHEGLTVAVLSTAQSAVAAVTPGGLMIGGRDDTAPYAGSKSWVRLGSDGDVTRGTYKAPAAGAAPRLTGWTTAGTEDSTGGTNPRYAIIDGPGTHDALGIPEGYGWWKWEIPSSAARKAKVLMPEAGDRVHLYRDGSPAAVLGLGPGATEAPATLTLKKGTNTVTALVDHLGRPSGGISDDQPPGVWGPIYEVAPLKAGKAALVDGAPVRLLDVRRPWTRTHADDETAPKRLRWSFTHRRKSPLIVQLGGVPTGVRAVLIVNDAPVAAIDEGSWSRTVLRPGVLRAGANTVEIAADADGTALKAIGVTFFECTADLTAKGAWSLARWEAPAVFEDADPASHTADGLPRWWRGRFTMKSPPREPLLLDPRGLTKGQLYLNGRNVGRYWSDTARGQQGLYLPEPWLRTGEPNELQIFDEHGASPRSVRLVPTSKLRG